MIRKIISLIFSITIVTAQSQTQFQDLSQESWQFYQENTHQKYKATIPGNVHLDLYSNQIIENPFFGNNEKKLQWIDNENWIYETYFDVTSDQLAHNNIQLICEGLDTYASIFINGKELFIANNMFITWEKEVKHLLKKKNNNLKIIFYSAIKKGKEEQAKLPYKLPEGERVFVRKAQYHFGWDWGPRMVTSGIWKPIYLKFWNNTAFNNVTVIQKKVTKQKAMLQFSLNLNVEKKGICTVLIGDKSHNFTLKKGNQIIDIPYEISEPKLWWCNGLGEPYLYQFNISVKKDNHIIGSKELKVGIRTIELITDKDEFGETFYFKINGEKVFIKGANYIPPDHFLSQANSKKYQEIVLNAKIANMNMLRVWGGGVYPDEAFLTTCDENGILVWQDFMFACAMYPGDNDFLESVAIEAKQQVERMQNHPSIALWCGNNENDEGWHHWGWQKALGYSKHDSTKIWNDYQKLFHKSIPQVLESTFGKKNYIYWASSPSKGWGSKEAYTTGDVHYWGVWWGMEPFEKYKEKVGRFVSEYGFQGMPSHKNWLTIADKDSLNFQSLQVKNRQKHPRGWQTIQTYMERDFPHTTDFESYIYMSQILQAYGLKIAIEAHRTEMPYCMGSLYWQLNDSWQGTSWSTLDYYNNWKAAHYQVKKSFENIILTFRQEKDKLTLYGVNDTNIVSKGALEIQFLDFEGKILFSILKDVFIESKQSQIIEEIKQEIYQSFNLKNTVVVARFNNEKIKTEQLHYFVKYKDLLLKNRPNNLQIKQINDTLFEFSSKTLIKNILLETDNQVVFSDNNFDLLPNNPIKITTDKSVSGLKINKLNDFYKE